MPHSNTRRLAFMILVACFVVSAFLDSAGARAGGPDDWLRWSDLYDIPRMLKRQREADRKDERESARMLDIGLRDMTRSNWGGGLKRLTDSAAIKPSVKALLGLSYCQARDSAYASNCVESISRRLCGFEDGMDQLQAAIEFHGVLGKASDVDEKTIAEYQMKIIQAQKMLLDDQRKCMNPRAIHSTIGKKQR